MYACLWRRRVRSSFQIVHDDRQGREPELGLCRVEGIGAYRTDDFLGAIAPAPALTVGTRKIEIFGDVPVAERMARYDDIASIRARCEHGCIRQAIDRTPDAARSGRTAEQGHLILCLEIRQIKRSRDVNVVALGIQSRKQKERHADQRHQRDNEGDGLDRLPHCPRLPAVAHRTASSAARISAAALLRDSCFSASGPLSPTTPPPAWTYITPSLTSAVRSTMQVSIEPSAAK